MEKLRNKLSQARKVRMLNDKSPEFAPGVSSAVSLRDMVVQKFFDEITEVKNMVDEDGEMSLKKFANVLLNGENGFKLFESNGMQVCFMENGELADTPLPFNKSSVLRFREPQYIVEKYGAKDCLAHLHALFDKIVAHEIKVYNDNREVVGLPPEHLT